MTKPGIVTMTKAEWLAEAERRFGKNFSDWRFVCPLCAHVAAIGDFKPYKADGATPDSARQECIGRYTNGRSAMYAKGEGPCDYAGYGLFQMSPVQVTDDDGRTVHSFAFAEAS